MTERHFSTSDRHQEQDPSIAFCGFDNAAARRAMDQTEIPLLLECGLGSSLGDFDQIDLHVFPSPRQTPEKLWGHIPIRLPRASKEIASLFGNGNEVCGALAIDVAGKSVSTSFVGAIAGVLATAEMLRIINRAPSCDDVSFDLRNPKLSYFHATEHGFSATDIGQLGVVTAK